MGLFGNSTAYYSGNECHKYIDSLVSEGSDVIIVSPYIDEYYAKFLLNNTRSKNIRILSSSMNGNAKKMLNENNNRGVIMALLVALTGVDYIVYDTKIFGAMILISAIAIAVLLFSVKNWKRRIFIRKPRGFVHAKLYISRSKAIHGSANLTYNGTHSNIEHIEIIKDREKIAKLRGEFERMWRDSAYE